MRDFFDPRIRTGMRLHDYLHTLVTLAVLVALLVVAFGAGYHVGSNQKAEIAAVVQAHPALPHFVASGTQAVQVMPSAPQLQSGVIYEVPLTAWRVKTNQQGSVGSCQAWAYAKLASYSYNSATFKATFWSPRAYYDLATGGNDEGSYFDQYTALYTSVGGIRWNTFPYAQNVYGLPVFADDPSVPVAVTAHTEPLRVTTTTLFADAGAGEGGVERIEAAILAGQPVNVDIPVYPEYDAAGITSDYIGLPKPNEQSRGGHANVLIAVMVDANGQVWFLTSNQWGRWGGLNKYGQPSANGQYAWLSGAFVAQYGWGAATVQVARS